MRIKQPTKYFVLLRKLSRKIDLSPALIFLLLTVPMFGSLCSLDGVSIVRSLSYLTDRTLPLFLCFWGISAVPTYAVIPAENICRLLAFYWPSLVIIQEMV